MKAEKNHTQKAFSALTALFLRNTWSNIINFWVVGILSRNLSKEDFGVVAVSLALVGFITSSATAGFGDYLVVYKGKEPIQKIYNSVFWLNSLFGVIAVVVIAALIPAWQYWYQDERIPLIIAILCFLVFSSFGIEVTKAAYKREFLYSKMVTVQSIFNTIANVMKIVIAMASWVPQEYKVLALILPTTISSVFTSIFLRIKAPYKLSIKMLGKEHWKEIFNFTKYVASNNIMNKVYNDGKSLILGKVLSLIELGVFSITNQVAGFFTRNIQPIITELSAPLLAINSHDKTRIRKNNSDMTIMLMVICFPLFTGLISISDRFCIIYLGEEIGNSVILPVKITLWGELFRTVLNPSSSIFNIFQRPKIPFKFNLFFVPASLILFIIFGKSWGLVGTCWFFTITNTLSKFYVLGKALTLIDGTLIELTKKMLPTLLGGSIACLLTYFVSTMVVPLPNNSVLGLIITTTIGAVIYYVCFITIARPNLITLLGFVNNIHKKFGAIASKLMFIKVA